MSKGTITITIRNDVPDGIYTNVRGIRGRALCVIVRLLRLVAHGDPIMYATNTTAGDVIDIHRIVESRSRQCPTSSQ